MPKNWRKKIQLVNSYFKKITKGQTLANKGITSSFPLKTKTLFVIFLKK